MQTYVPLTEELEAPAPAGYLPSAVQTVTPPQPQPDSVESLRDALRAAEVRPAYFERFGPWVQEQMAAMVEYASSLEHDCERLRTEATTDAARMRAEVAEEVAGMRRDAERERQEIAGEIARYREEIESLNAECERKREEARATVAQAHKASELVMGRLNESAASIVQRALADFESLRHELTPEALAATTESLPMPAESENDELAQDEEPKRAWRPFSK
jgi:hypothetical protein